MSRPSPAQYVEDRATGEEFVEEEGEEGDEDEYALQTSGEMYFSPFVPAAPQALQAYRLMISPDHPRLRPRLPPALRDCGHCCYPLEE